MGIENPVRQDCLVEVFLDSNRLPRMYHKCVDHVDGNQRTWEFCTSGIMTIESDGIDRCCESEKKIPGKNDHRRGRTCNLLIT